MKEEPVRSRAEVELQGLALHPEIVEPSFGIIIRKNEAPDPIKVFFEIIIFLPIVNICSQINIIAKIFT